MKNEKNILAVIDIGSHLVRLYIGQIVRKGKIKIIEYLWVPIALGKDVFTNNYISDSTSNELLNVLTNFQITINTYKITNIKAIATSSFREASNTELLIDRVKRTTGITIEVWEPIEELELIYNAFDYKILQTSQLVEQNIFLFIVGAGSTQVLYMNAGKIVYSETFNIGTLRMERLNELNEKSSNLFVENFAKKIFQSFNNYKEDNKIDKFYVVNNDVLDFIKRYNLTQKNKTETIFKVSKPVFKNIFLNMHSTYPKLLYEKYKLHENLAQSTRTALLLTGKFFDLIKCKKIFFPDINLSYALLWSISIEDAKRKKIVKNNIKNHIMSSAVSLGKKYNFNFLHAKRTRQFSLIIFNYLKKKYKFTVKEKLYLKVSALLHDIGKFINAKSHHKHSATLIASSEIIGLNKLDMNIIAQIVRYHRGPSPKTTHSNFMKLSQRHRNTVVRMTSILRLAEAIDVSYLNIAEDLKVESKNGKFELQIKLTGNIGDYMDLLKMNIKSKSDLFESCYGLWIDIIKLVE